MSMETLGYTHGELGKFLKRYKTIKRSNFSHTSIAKPAGSFYIPKDQESAFFTTYTAAMKNGEELFMTEKHADISPILIDLDLRFPASVAAGGNVAHRYTQEDVESVIRAYLSALQDMLVFTKATFYVMEKPSGSIDKGLFKDGFHIVVPDIVTRAAVQYKVREKVIEVLRNEEVFNRMGATNDITDIIDERVIEFNNWQLYGSKKPGGHAYKIVYIYTWEDGRMAISGITKPHESYVQLLSIRNKYRETPITPERVEALEAYENAMYAEREKKKCVSAATQKNKQGTKNEYPYLGLVENLVRMLDPSRAVAYDSWIRVGWMLRNIDFKLLPLWIDFSRGSPKFVDGECERHWDYMREDGLGIGTLHMWAKKDNPTAYQEAVSNDLSCLIKVSLSKSHYDIAKVVHHMYQHQYVCISIKNKLWYEFRDHRWHPCDGGYTLRNHISSDVYNEFIKLGTWYNNQALMADPSDQAKYTTCSQTCNAIALKLKDTGFKGDVMRECGDMFYMPKFEDKLDSRTNLIGFKDGVLDLDTMEFREGHPEDWISFSTNTVYREYSENDSQTREIMTFLTAIMPKDDMRDYMMKVMASCLDGVIREERFHIWTGSGSNGKSKILELLMNALGDYYCNMNVTAITGKRVSSNSTNSELVRAKGRRALVMQEPGDDEKMNVGWMKELTGGDRLIARGLFKEPVEFKPQFKMFLTCNSLPKVPSEDGGTWRRIRLMEFTSRFVENPDPSKPNEYMMDKELSSKFDAWRETFTGILIEYYRKYREEGSIEPDEVMECTKKYQRESDAIGEFMDDRFDRDDTAYVSIDELYNDFREWIRESNPGMKTPRRKEVQAYIEKVWGKPVRAGSRMGWKGYRLRSHAPVIAHEEESDFT